MGYRSCGECGGERIGEAPAGGALASRSSGGVRGVAVGATGFRGDSCRFLWLNDCGVCRARVTLGGRRASRAGPGTSAVDSEFHVIFSFAMIEKARKH